MSSTRLGEDFRVEIPPEMRERLGLKVGHEVAFLPVGNGFRLVRVLTTDELRGSLPDFDWSDYRDETDRDL